MNRFIPFAMVMVGVGCLCINPSAYAQDEHCDKELKISQDRQDRGGYKPRGEKADKTDRCEGVISDDTGRGTFIHVASFMHSFAPYPTASGEQTLLIVTWSLPTPAPLRIQAKRKGSGLRYQMNTTRPLGDSTFFWPTKILVDRNITRDLLDVWGTFVSQESCNNRDVYAPLRIAPQGLTRPELESFYRVSLIAEKDIHKVQTTLQRCSTSGEANEMIWENRVEGGGGTYKSRDHIEVDIPIETLAPGYYFLSLTAPLKGADGMASAHLTFYHAPQ